LNWEREIPRYRVIRATGPAHPPRVHFDTPISNQADQNSWQFGEREYQPGEEISTTHWPHPNFQPLNESARAVLQFFGNAMKSRLPLSPWRGDRLNLNDGLSGPCQPGLTLGKPEGRAA
jgi:hypothetical protein